jgi:hypothetical protein
MSCFKLTIHTKRLSVGGRTDGRTHARTDGRTDGRTEIFTQYSGISSCSLGSTDCFVVVLSPLPHPVLAILSTVSAIVAVVIIRRCRGRCLRCRHRHCCSRPHLPPPLPVLPRDLFDCCVYPGIVTESVTISSSSIPLANARRIRQAISLLCPPPSLLHSVPGESHAVF